MDRDFMGDLYSDLFGEGDGGEHIDPGRVTLEDLEAAGLDDAIPVLRADGKSAADPVPPAPDGASAAPAADSASPAGGAVDPMKKVREALEEAKSLFEGGSVIPIPSGSGDEPLSFVDVMGKDGDGNGAETAHDEAAVEGTEVEAEAASSAAEEPEDEKDPMEELDALVGLTSIKHDVRELADFVKVQQMRKNEGLKSVPVSLHLVFTGNPGTGKTTVARIIAKIYKNIGVLSKGQLVEVDRAGLVAGYVGQTALKTREKIAEAKGGVLFIDEAYALSRKDDTFGQEAIDTLLKSMEDEREDFVVIVAGYTGPMKEFIESNPGLKSRFNKYIEFPDYTVDELMEIFDLNCSKYDYVLEEDARKHVREIIVARKLAETENFANAREVRNLFEAFITNQARRVNTLKDPSHEDMMTITMDDLELEVPAESVSREEEAEESVPRERAAEEVPEADLADGTYPEAGEEGAFPETGADTEDL